MLKPVKSLVSINIILVVFLQIWNNDIVFKGLDSQSKGPCSNPVGGSNSTFHLSEVDQMSTWNFGELSGKK